MEKSHFTRDGRPILGRATLEERVTYRARALEQECIHFTGVLQETCRAGVRYWDIGPQPCLLQYDTGKHVCPHREFPAPDVAQANALRHEQEIEEALHTMHARMAAHQCLYCGEPYDALRQVGPCVYAVPCGHRQYQGRVPTEDRSA